MIEMLEQVFKNYKKIYNTILLDFDFYPSLGSTGFQERNLTVYFSKAFDETYGNQNVISWFELQFGEKRNCHFDCVIITKSEIFFVESKRFSNPNDKIESVSSDIERIQSFINEKFDSDERFMKYKNHDVYGVILSDVWLETPVKKDIREQFINKSFFKQFGLGNGEYNVIDFDIYRGYSLLSFVWNLKLRQNNYKGKQI